MNTDVKPIMNLQQKSTYIRLWHFLEQLSLITAPKLKNLKSKGNATNTNDLFGETNSNSENSRKYYKLENEQTIAEFLETYPLYKKFETDEWMMHPGFWINKVFQFYCERENDTRTFKISIPEFTDQLSFHRNKFFSSDGKSDYVQHLIGICQSCQKSKVHFLLNYFSDIPITISRHQVTDILGDITIHSDRDENYNPKFHLRKIGQFPAFAIKPDKEIETFLEDLDKEYYRKALICLSQSFGIAAYSYFRRIVETEVLRIVEHLLTLEFPDKQKIELAYILFKRNHQMDPFLAEIDPYLPAELKVLHEHPLRLLYTELSLGIHAYEEDTCLQNARTINDLLTFIIKALNTKKRNKELSDRLKNIGKR